MPLTILIVGAGIAGLSSAVALRRAGHRVLLFERSSMNNEVGAAINVPPNASRFLTKWGLNPVEEGFVKATCVDFVDPFSMKPIIHHSHDRMEEIYGGAALWFAHRVDLHDSLKKIALSEDGVGIKVEVRLKTEVVEYDPEAPSITLATGEKVYGDMVIGADGVHSLASKTVLGRNNIPVPPAHHNCCYRFLIPAAALEEDPATSFFNENSDGRMVLFPDNQTRRRLVSYPCRRNTIHNFVGIFYDEEMKRARREDYLAGVDKSIVMEKFKGYNPSLIAVISKATEIKRWPLLYRPPIPTWRKKKLILAGDSAHPMLPHQGQGGAQGLEDGVVMGIVMCGASTPEDIGARLALYEKIRRNRASSIQIMSNVGQDQTHLVRKELMEFIPEKDIPGSPAEQYLYCYGYDAVQHALTVMKEYDSSFELSPGFFSEN